MTIPTFNMKLHKTPHRHCDGGPMTIGPTVAIPNSKQGMGDRHTLLSVGFAMAQAWDVDSIKKITTARK